jgi:hypothetical protein
MHIPSPRAPIWHSQLAALAMVAVLAGCASQGDFGEVRSTLVRDDMHDWIGRPTSAFEYTDDERQLRDLAYALVEPPYDRKQWYSVAGEYGLTGADRWTDRSAYAHHLLSSRYRSPSARYAQLTEDARNDIARLPEFFETASRVTDIDQKRRKSLAYVSNLSAGEKYHAQLRIKDNGSVIALVREKITQRIAAYRFALERLVVMSPSPQAVEVERSVNQLQSQYAYYRSRSAPTWTREQSLAAVR